MRVTAGTIPIKTAAGQSELTTRRLRVSQRHRTVLFLVDGKRPETEVRRMALQAGVPGACFDELLALGLIVRIELIDSPGRDLGSPPSVFHVDLPLLDESSPQPDSELPPSRTLYPSLSADSSLLDPSGVSWYPSESGALGVSEPGVAEARAVLLRAVRAEAPLAGSLTLLRLRRARTRADLRALLDEVESRISKPHRSLSAAQTMRRARQLLDGKVDSSLEPA